MKLENKLTNTWKYNVLIRFKKMFDNNIKIEKSLFKWYPVEVWTIDHYWKKWEIIRKNNKCILARDY